MASSKYIKEIHDEQCYKLRLLGLSLAEIADIFGVTKKTVRVWRKEHVSFGEAWSNGGPAADAEVAHALHRRAVGQKVEETKHFVVDGMIETVTYDRQVLGDVSAQTKWLSKRNNRWQDKQVLDVRAEVTTIDTKRLSTEALKELLAARNADDQSD